MPIKFPCPNCQQPLSVKDELAGKRGPCPKCKKMLTVPQAAAPVAKPFGESAAPKPVGGDGASTKPAPVPTPSLADVEAEAAAVFGDKPAEAVPAAATGTIDFECPMCGEALKMPV